MSRQGKQGLFRVNPTHTVKQAAHMMQNYAISAIAVVGAILLAGEQESGLSTWLGAIAVFASTTNIVSGFLITDRMLKMFKKREVAK